jgi:hypothetical protein
MLFPLALAVKRSLLVLWVPLALVVKRTSVSCHVLFLCFFKTLECCISILRMGMGSSSCLKNNGRGGFFLENKIDPTTIITNDFYHY